MNKISEILETNMVINVHTKEIYKVHTRYGDVFIRNVDDKKELNPYIWHGIRPCDLLRNYEVYGTKKPEDSERKMTCEELQQLESLLEKFEKDEIAAKEFWFKNCSGKTAANIASELKQRVQSLIKLKCEKE